jgi:hypothetical protein
VALRADVELDLSATELATVVVEITALGDGLLPGNDAAPLGDPATFGIDVCRGCLLVPPLESACADGISSVPVCRPGQDEPSFACASS